MIIVPQSGTHYLSVFVFSVSRLKQKRRTSSTMFTTVDGTKGEQYTTCTQGVKNLLPMTSYPVAHSRPFFVQKRFAKSAFHLFESRLCTNHEAHASVNPMKWLFRLAFLYIKWVLQLPPV